MPKVAVLDEDSRLVGVEELPDAGDRIEVPAEIDLPLDGSYRWDGKHRAFLHASMPAQVFLARSLVRGAGGSPAEHRRAPVDPDYALFLALRALRDGTPMPAEVMTYLEWYEAEILERAENRVRPDKRRRD